MITTVAPPGCRKYPYLLCGLDTVRPNQVWEMCVTYVPMRHGFLCLAVIIDVLRRRIKGWCVSNTMGAGWCALVAEDYFVFSYAKGD